MEKGIWLNPKHAVNCFLLNPYPAIVIRLLFETFGIDLS
jgi:hypothetical protein